MFVSLRVGRAHIPPLAYIFLLSRKMEATSSFVKKDESQPSYTSSFVKKEANPFCQRSVQKQEGKGPLAKDCAKWPERIEPKPATNSSSPGGPTTLDAT